jgi:hypothetical protein
MMASTDNLYNAQSRLNIAQINYTLAVRDYGASSIQAARAQDQLSIATNGLTIAQDRLDVKYVEFALSTGPQIYAAITKLAAASAGMTVQNYEEAASWYAKAAAIGLTVGLLTLGIGVVAGLASGAAVNQTINQQNQFYGSGANPAGAVNAANNSLAASVASASRP